MRRTTTIIPCVLALAGQLSGQESLDGTFHELKLSVKSLDITRSEEKGEPDTISKGSTKFDKQSVYVEVVEGKGDGFRLDLWVDEDGTFVEYEGAGTMGPVATDEKGKKLFTEFMLDVTTLADPTPAEGTAEGLTIDGILSLKLKEQAGEAVPGTDEVQEITGTGANGDYNLTFDGQETADINGNADAATVQSALEALSTVGAGNVAVSGGPLPTALVVTFTGALGETDVPELIVTDDTTDDTDIAAATTTPGLAAMEGTILKSASFKLEKDGASSRSYDGDDYGTPKLKAKYVPQEKLPEGLGDAKS